MATRFLALVLTLLSTSTLVAQPGEFGHRAPLTATRYTAFGAYPALVDNGRELFLYWVAGTQMRVTRLNGVPRVGRPVMDVDQGLGFGVVWTGSHFLAMASRRGDVVARLLDSSGEPLGAQYVVTRGRDPRLAFNGTNVAVLYTESISSDRTRLLVVNRNGIAIGVDPVLIDEHAGAYHSAIASEADGFVVLVASADEVRLVRLTHNGAIASQSIVTAASTGWRQFVTLAGNGAGYMATWQESERIIVHLISADGRAGRRFAINAEENENDLRVGAASAVWNNGAWDLAYSVWLKSDRGEIRTMRIDSDGAVIGRGAPRQGAISSLFALTSCEFQGHTFITWLQSELGGGTIVDLGPLVVQDATTNGEPIAVAFSSAEQGISAAASSSDSLLVLWGETKPGGGSRHQGVRSRMGTWSEQEIDPTAAPYYAASDGKGFGVVQYHGPGIWSVSILDAQGQLVARTRQISDSFYAWGIASNGDGYVVVGPRIRAPRDIVAVRIRANGTVGEPVILAPAPPQSPGSFNAFESFLSVTSDGTNYLALLKRESMTCVNCFEWTKTILGFRFDASLRRLDAENFVVADFSIDPLVVPTGNGWTVVWKRQSGSSSSSRTIGSNGTMSNAGSFGVSDVVSIAPFGPNALAALSSTGRVSIVRNGFPYASKELGEPYGKPFLAPLPGGGIAYLAAMVERNAPFHGSGRIAIVIGDVVLPTVPDAPRTTARLANGWAVVDWSAPAQRVTAYRVEYRVGDGSWNELEASLDGSALSIIALQPKSGVSYAFRVRAVNEAGPGAYSETVTVGGTRRHAVRR